MKDYLINLALGTISTALGLLLTYMIVKSVLFFIGGGFSVLLEIE